jgi:hypothetical protein
VRDIGITIDSLISITSTTPRAASPAGSKTPTQSSETSARTNLDLGHTIVSAIQLRAQTILGAPSQVEVSVDKSGTVEACRTRQLAGSTYYLAEERDGFSVWRLDPESANGTTAPSRFYTCVEPEGEEWRRPDSYVWKSV